MGVIGSVAQRIFSIALYRWNNMTPTIPGTSRADWMTRASAETLIDQT